MCRRCGGGWISELAAYARGPNLTVLPAGMTLYLNFFLGPIARFIGSAAVTRDVGATYAVTELAHPPFAYALTMGERPDAPALLTATSQNSAGIRVWKASSPRPRPSLLGPS